MKWLWKIAGAWDKIDELERSREWWIDSSKHHEKEAAKLRGGSEPWTGPPGGKVIQQSCYHILNQGYPGGHQFTLGPNHTVDVCNDCYDGIVGRVIQGLTYKLEMWEKDKGESITRGKDE